MLIAISGKSYSGKTAIANCLHSYGFSKVSFATILKRVVDVIDTQALMREMLDDSLCRSSSSQTPAAKEEKRLLYQMVGAAFRLVDPDFWIKQLEKEMASYVLQANWVVDDLRYENEAFALERQGFYLVRIDVDEEVREERARKAGVMISPESKLHQSEIDLDGWGKALWRMHLDFRGLKSSEIPGPSELAMSILHDALALQLKVAA